MKPGKNEDARLPMTRSTFRWSNPTQSQMQPNPDNVIDGRQSPRHTHIRAEKNREWIWRDNQRRASPLFLWNFKYDGYSFDSQKLFHSLTAPFLWHFIRSWMSSPISLKKAEVLLSIVGMCDYTCLCFPVLALFLQALFLYPSVQVFLFHVAIFHQLSGHILKWGHRKGKWGVPHQRQAVYC